MSSNPREHGSSRREFLKRTVATGAALAGGLSLARSVHAAGSGTIRIALDAGPAQPSTR